MILKTTINCIITYGLKININLDISNFFHTFTCESEIYYYIIYYTTLTNDTTDNTTDNTNVKMSKITVPGKEGTKFTLYFANNFADIVLEAMAESNTLNLDDMACKTKGKGRGKSGGKK